MFDKLDDILFRLEEVLNQLNEPGVANDPGLFQKLMKEQAELQPIADAYQEYKNCKQTIEDSVAMLEEENDEEMREMLKEELSEAKKRVDRILELMGLEEHAGDIAGSLPYGLQRRLEIARILAANPKLLLLDEPAAGMNPQESMELVERIRSIREQFGVTILLIEHDMKVIMSLCEYIYAMATGEIIAQGVPDEIRRDPKVIQAYLGRVV